MNTKTKRIIVLLMAMLLTLSTVFSALAASSTQTGPKKPAHDTFKGTTNLTGIRKAWQGNTSISVPGTQTYGGKKHTVKVVKAKAFTKCKKVQTVTLPKTVTQINKHAFYGCKKLKKINIKSAKKIRVYKNAFNGGGLKHYNVTITVTKKMSKANFNYLKKQLKKNGFRGKLVKSKKW